MNETRALFSRLSHGVYVIGAAHGDQRDAFTAAWVMQVSFDPLMLAVSINPEHVSYALVKNSGAFTVSVLRHGQLELARRFGTRSGRDYEKLAGVRWHPARSGAPVLEEALAFFDCEVAGNMPSGDHELVLGRVIDGRIIDPAAVPMMYTETGDMDGSDALYPAQL
jgi:flavin reductase (DIM6/NTAB) family NADH-FMN oxidoreductase RutF